LWVRERDIQQAWWGYAVWDESRWKLREQNADVRKKTISRSLATGEKRRASFSFTTRGIILGDPDSNKGRGSYLLQGRESAKRGEPL